MTESIRILIVEDLPTDAELAQREIRKTLKSCIFQRVESREDFEVALSEFKPDLIISDYRMPRFDGLTALKLTLEKMPLVPVIILTGAINEDTAVECMKAGANNYVIKEHLKRLGQAVVHALEEKRIRQDRYQAERLLLFNEKRYRHLVESSNDWIWEMDKDAIYTYAGPQCREFLGYEPEEIIGKKPFDLMPPEEAKRVSAIFRILAGRKDPFRGLEKTNINKNGALVFLETNGAPILDDKGVFLGYRGLDRNITERKRAEQAIRESEARYRTLIHTSPDAMVVVDLNGCITYVSPSSRQFFHIGDEPLSAMIGQKATDWIHPDYHARAVAAMKHMMESEVVRNEEFVLFKKDGSTFFAEISASCIRDDQGQTSGFLWLARDISERKHAEEERTQLQAQLLQAQKMESIGRLAGGVAHDFNNMLSVILGYTELIQNQLSPDDPMVGDIMQIERAGRRARDITQQLLAFSRKQIIEPTSLDLNELIAATQKGLARLIGEDIDLRFCPNPDLYKIRFDPSQLDQILINLAVNARDAMPQGGKLTIETVNINIDESFSREHLGFIPGDYVLLTVSDSGMGMDKVTLSHAFEPFFTTKAIGKGTGLGLATVYGIVNQGGGFIEAFSEPGKGSVFKIYFPRMIDEETPALESKGFQPEPGTGTVMVVEDDGMVRDMTVAMLESVGYKVLPAETPKDAIEFCQKSGTTIDLLITDVVMPELSGAELRDRILKMRPGIKVLFISGYASDIIAHHGVLDEGVNFIRKPFSMNDLALAVRNVIQR